MSTPSEVLQTAQLFAVPAPELGMSVRQALIAVFGATIGNKIRAYVSLDDHGNPAYFVRIFIDYVEPTDVDWEALLMHIELDGWELQSVDDDEDVRVRDYRFELRYDDDMLMYPWMDAMHADNHLELGRFNNGGTLDWDMADARILFVHNDASPPGTGPVPMIVANALAAKWRVYEVPGTSNQVMVDLEVPTPDTLLVLTADLDHEISGSVIEQVRALLLAGGRVVITGGGVNTRHEFGQLASFFASKFARDGSYMAINSETFEPDEEGQPSFTVLGLMLDTEFDDAYPGAIIAFDLKRPGSPL